MILAFYEVQINYKLPCLCKEVKLKGGELKVKKKKISCV